MTEGAELCIVDGASRAEPPPDTRDREADREAETRLRRLIRRKTSEKERLEREMGDVAGQMARVAEPRRAEARALDDEIHALFARIVEGPGLSRQAREDIAGIHRSLQQSGVISARPLPNAPEPEPGGEEHEPCGCPFCAAEAFEDEEDVGPGFGAGGGGAEPGASGRKVPYEAEARSAVRPEGLRDLYRELAARFHPDHADSDDARARCEQMMRRINAAYHAGDADALTALAAETGCAARSPLRDLEDQYERVKAEVRALRASELGELVVATRKSKNARAPDPFAELERDFDEEVESLRRIRAHAAAFCAGDIDLEDFLAGPDAGEPEGYDDDELLEALASLISGLADAPAAEGGKRRGRDRPRTDKAQRKRQKAGRKRNRGARRR